MSNLCDLIHKVYAGSSNPNKIVSAKQDTTLSSTVAREDMSAEKTTRFYPKASIATMYIFRAKIYSPEKRFRLGPRYWLESP